MHDRRLNGETLTFGNQGALYLNAMTWWDHSTESIWSQPWGTAIEGPLDGEALTLLPASIVPWNTWLQEHPDTTVLGNNDVASPTDDGNFSDERARDDFVIGVALQDSATAYDYRTASVIRVINDSIGGHPVAVFVDRDSRDIKVYLRRIDSNDSESPVLTFVLDDQGQIVDTETESVWSTTFGVASEGDLKGTVLQQIPYVTAFDWAWQDFFPHTTFYKP